jgi:hypothetical protein
MVRVPDTETTAGGPVVLIGPLAVGKTTVGVALASLLNLPPCLLDEVRWQYFDEIGYDRDEAARRFASGRTVPEKLAYGMPFEVHAIERAVADHQDGVIDLGASNSVFEDPQLLARAEAALSGANVVLLLPSPDPTASARILADRLRAIVESKGERLTDELLGLNEYFIRHPANGRLARLTVYTGDRTPDEIAREIAQWLAEAP